MIHSTSGLHRALLEQSDYEYLVQHCNAQTAHALGDELIAWAQSAPKNKRVYHSNTELITSCMPSPQQQYAFITQMSNLAPRCHRTYYFMALQEILHPEVADYLVSDLGAIWDRYRLTLDPCERDCCFCEGAVERANGSFFSCLASCIATVSKQPLDVTRMERTEIGRVILCIMLADALRLRHDSRTLITWERFPESLADHLKQDAIGIAHRSGNTLIAQQYPYIRDLADKLKTFLE